MTQEGAVPPAYGEYLRRIIREEIAAYARSGASRNMSIGEGGTFTVKGGQLRVLYPAEDGGGVGLFFGDLKFETDGSYAGTGLSVQAPDGTDILTARTTTTTDYPIVLIRDGQGNILISTDSVGGQGLTRPYLSTGFYRQRFADWTVQTTDTAWEGLWKAEVQKQTPGLYVGVQCSMDTSGTSGEVRVLVDGVQMGDIEPVGWALSIRRFGPAAVAGTHNQTLTVEIQGRVPAGVGAMKVEPLYMLGRQI